MNNHLNPIFKGLLTSFGVAPTTKTTTMEPLEPGDKFVREYIKDQPRFVQCWEFLDQENKTYTICQDQDGEEWIEE